MSQPNPGGDRRMIPARDGNQLGTQEKRRRSPTPDEDEHARERSVRRVNDAHRYVLAQSAPGPSRHVFRMSSRAAEFETTRRAIQNMGSRLILPLTATSGSSRHQFRDRLPRSGGDKKCEVCGSSTHVADECRMIVNNNELEDRQQGFKRWCPYHRADHTIDECKQKWTWLRCEHQTRELLLLNCGSGPAFATNLIDWRCLLDADVSVDLPWTPEFARLQKRDDPEFHERLGRKRDSSTSFAGLRKNLGWQTDSGKEPQFRNYPALQKHAEREYQEELGREKRLAEKKKKEQEEQATFEHYMELVRKAETAKEAAERYRLAHSGNPKLANKLAKLKALHIANIDETNHRPNSGSGS
ncbi:hypothetical protein F4678DRAFT_460436 [Xylaria arbuscula]|nr:hypothetical protein F4678DRAFT_460436 [Xylaria arbuscula]